MARKGKTKRTNKQHAPFDPRVDIFKQFYLRPDSYTFMNIRQSALRAGYTDQYANNLSTNNGPLWFVEMLESADHQRARMLKAAEDNLLNTVTGEAKDTTEQKLKHDATKFVSERLGKEHYSTRQEITDKDGRRLFQSNAKESTDIAISDLFAGIAADKGKDSST